MISFITLTDIDNKQIELNPAFIVWMMRSVTDTDEGAMIPFTNISLSSGSNIYVMETPEEISNLQIQTIARSMAALMPMFNDLMEDID
jgi:uncharacterized protein YlzI (FlbEa/FlbD family)